MQRTIKLYWNVLYQMGMRVQSSYNLLMHAHLGRWGNLSQRADLAGLGMPDCGIDKLTMTTYHLKRTPVDIHEPI